MSELSALELENLFIKLKGEGKSLAEIRELLPSATEGQINKWENDLSEAKKQPWYINNENFRLKITGRNKDGNYFYNADFNFPTSNLNIVLFDLKLYSNIKPEKRDNQTIEFKQNCQAAHEVISKYVTELNELSYDKTAKKFNFSYHAKIEKENDHEKIKNALSFYIENIYAARERAKAESLIGEPSSDSYSFYENSKDYAIKQLKIKNYQGIVNVEVDEIPVDAPWIFLTGENGFGKSCILKGIAISLVGIQDEEQILLSDEKARISVEYKAGNNNIINNIRNPFFRPLAELACYGPSRLQVQSDQTQNEINKKSSKTYSLFNVDGVLLSIESEMLIWYLSRDKRFYYVKALFCEIIPYLRDIKIVNNRHLRYVEQEVNSQSGAYPEVTFEQLASGFRSIIAMVGDMIIRLFKTQPEIENPTELKGIVIIDELDLHWHPKLQRSLPSLLSKAFPKIQFIASTHSVIPILGAPKGSVFLKVNRTVEEGITVEKLDLEVENLLPNTLLTSSLFDMEQISSVANENLADIHTENSFTELNENEEIRKALEEFEKSNQVFPEELYKNQTE